jgi:hypothetical protein
MTFPIEEEEVPGYQKENFYPLTPGEAINKQFEIIVELGFGQHSTVWLAKRNQRFVPFPLQENNTDVSPVYPEEQVDMLP